MLGSNQRRLSRRFYRPPSSARVICPLTSAYGVRGDVPGRPGIVLVIVSGAAVGADWLLTGRITHDASHVRDARALLGVASVGGSKPRG